MKPMIYICKDFASAEENWKGMCLVMNQTGALKKAKKSTLEAQSIDGTVARYVPVDCAELILKGVEISGFEIYAVVSSETLAFLKTRVR